MVFKKNYGLEEYLKFYTDTSYTKNFLLEEERFEDKVILKLNEKSGWESECSTIFFQTRPLYLIWKGFSCLIVSIVSIALLIMLIKARYNRYIQSRFFSPYISTILFFLGSTIRLAFVLASFDNHELNLMTTAILIFVFSLYSLQTIRYFLCRWFYKRYYESDRKETFWFKIISSKTTYILFSIGLLLVESILIYLISIINDIGLRNDVLDYLTLAAFAGLIILSLTATTLYLIVNRSTIRQLGSLKKVLKWYFVYDDTFKYHGELITVVITAIGGLAFFLLSYINGLYMSVEYFMPVRSMMASHIAGYALYGLSKTFFEVCLVCFEPGYLLLMYWYDLRQPVLEFEGLKELKAEMDIFLAYKTHNVSCIDIMKKFLVNEFRAELLELYLFVTKNNHFN